MPKYEVNYGVIDWYSGIIEADDIDHAYHLIECGEVKIKCFDSELYGHGIEIKEYDPNDYR